MNKQIEETSFWKFHRFRAIKDFSMFTCNATSMNTNKSGTKTLVGGGIQYFMFNDIAYKKLIDLYGEKQKYFINKDSLLTCETKTVLSINDLIESRKYIEEIFDLSEENYPEYE